MTPIFGIDAEPRAARTARMNMLLWGDGKCVVRGNALAESDFSGNSYAIKNFDPATEDSGCSLILANPPFGAREKEDVVLRKYRFGSQSKKRKSQKTEVLFLEKALKLLRPEGRLLIVLPTGLLSADSYESLRMHILRKAWIKAIVNLPTHTFVQSGVPTVNTVVLYLQKYSSDVAKKVEQDFSSESFPDFKSLMSEKPELDYDIFMADCEDVGFEPSGRSTQKPGELTDLERISRDFVEKSFGDLSELDIFSFAERLYGTKSFRRRDQVIRGSRQAQKVSFSVRASALKNRMDPSYYVFSEKSRSFKEDMEPIGQRVETVSSRFRPESTTELDMEFCLLSVSSDGKVTAREVVRGEDILTAQKKVQKGDIVYNPMRANIGSIGIVGEDLAGGLVSPDYHVIRPVDIDAEYLIGLLRTPFYKFYIDVVTTGSIRDRLYPQDLQRMLIPRTKVSNRTKIKRIQSAILEEAARSYAALAGLSKDLNETVREMLPSAPGRPGNE